ncbi:MAG TPA: PaaI family thioesterase [Ilumatobacteraceae bacterium]|nr:PaaI family thioesterase [Ilumatobacteraceae bacterium]
MSLPAPYVDEDDDEDPAYAAHVRLADALRRVQEANARVAVASMGADIDDLIADVESVAERLEAHAGPRAVGRRPDVILDDPGRAMPLNPIAGHCNPVAPPVTMSLRGGEVTGTARLGQAYEGPPGRVHGGWVCGLLDQVLGFACVAAEQPSFTASLTVHLREATPLHTDLELRGRVTDVSGRRVKVWGAIYADGALTAEAEGLFVRVPSDFGRDMASD